MIIVDRALERRERENDPIRVGLVGAGFMGRGIALQMLTATPGMELVAIASRRLEPAVQAYAEGGVESPEHVGSVAELEQAIAAGRPAVTEDALLVAEAEGIDAIVEVTGAVEHGAHVVLHAIEHGKHVILMNAELDGTLGPVLKERADRAGVVYTNSDGDQPGVMMNLYRFVKGIGVRPVLIGNVKGLHDPYRNPTTQEGFARRWGQKAKMVSSFADGTKISFEQALLANATGMRVAKRGMHGYTVEPGTTVEEAAQLFDAEELLEGPGIVDYVVGASPAPGVFVVGTHSHPLQRHYLSLYKLGEGPLYCFYTPYHLCHFEVPDDGRPSGRLRRRHAGAGRADPGRGRGDGQGRPRAGRRARRLRRLPLLRPGGERRRRRRRAPAPDGADGRGREGRARRRQGRGAHLRRRRAPGGPPVRPPPRRAGRRRLLLVDHRDLGDGHDEAAAPLPDPAHLVDDLVP